MTNAEEIDNILLTDDAVLVTSTTTTTTSNKLVDTNSNFTTLAIKIGDKVSNTTDSTTAYVTAIDDANTLSISSDIMTSGEGYQLINQVIVYTADVTKNYNKKLSQITAPQSSGNWASGPKTTKIIDLLRVEIRFTVNGLIEDGSQTALQNLFSGGGVFTMAWDDTDYEINMDKLEIKRGRGNESGQKDVMFTCIVGANI